MFNLNIYFSVHVIVSFYLNFPCKRVYFIGCWCYCRWSVATSTDVRVRHCFLGQHVVIGSVLARTKKSVLEVMRVKRIPATSRKATCVLVSIQWC